MLRYYLGITESALKVGGNGQVNMYISKNILEDRYRKFHAKEGATNTFNPTKREYLMDLALGWRLLIIVYENVIENFKL